MLKKVPLLRIKEKKEIKYSFARSPDIFSLKSNPRLLSIKSNGETFSHGPSFMAESSHAKF